MLHETPGRPWQKVAAYVAFLDNNRYLVAVDYFFKFIEVVDTKSITIIKVLKQHLTRYGIPDNFICDDGPEFSGSEFKNFARDYQFEHTTSSPRYPQNNGNIVNIFPF
ncbi:hypothetical protein ScPMuIL_008923 [Solemya velum]